MSTTMIYTHVLESRRIRRAQPGGSPVKVVACGAYKAAVPSPRHWFVLDLLAQMNTARFG